MHLIDAFKRVSQSPIASLAFVVDAKDEDARQFYLRHGFITLLGRPNRLFLPRTTFATLCRG